MLGQSDAFPTLQIALNKYWSHSHWNDNMWNWWTDGVILFVTNYVKLGDWFSDVH